MNGHHVQGRYSSPSAKMLNTQSLDEESHVSGLGIQCYASSRLICFQVRTEEMTCNPGFLRNVAYIECIDHISSPGLT